MATIPHLLLTSVGHTARSSAILISPSRGFYLLWLLLPPNWHKNLDSKTERGRELGDYLNGLKTFS